MPAIVVTDRLEARHLKGLITGEFLAVRVKGYCSAAQCEKMAAFALGQNAENYPHEKIADGTLQEVDYGVLRVGNPFNRVAARPDLAERTAEYFSTAQTNFDRIQDSCLPEETPFAQFCSDLRNSAWTHGAYIPSMNSGKMFAGIIRITMPDAHVLEEAPHIDSLNAASFGDLDYGYLDNTFNAAAQLSANFYLDMPAQGGELVVYDHAPLSEMDAKIIEGDKQKWQDLLLGAKAHTLKPEKGDLVLINTRCAHAVKTFPEGAGRRITQQTFIGVRTLMHPLALWV